MMVLHQGICGKGSENLDQFQSYAAILPQVPFNGMMWYEHITMCACFTVTMLCNLGTVPGH